MNARVPGTHPSRRTLVLSAAALCAGCTTVVEPPQVEQAAAEWHSMPLPGKRETKYTRCDFEGRPAWHAHSQAAASVWRKRMSQVVTPDTQAEFSWWVASTIGGADLGRADVADSPVRVGFGFDGDVSRLSMRNRMQFQLIETLTGEAPPFAMLRQWRSYRRNLYRDFQRVVGEPPGRLIGLALMTDTDNTSGSVEAWYGDVVLTR